MGEIDTIICSKKIVISFHIQYKRQLMKLNDIEVTKSTFHKSKHPIDISEVSIDA